MANTRIRSYSASPRMASAWALISSSACVSVVFTCPPSMAGYQVIDLANHLVHLVHGRLVLKLSVDFDIVFVIGRDSFSVSLAHTGLHVGPHGSHRNKRSYRHNSCVPKPDGRCRSGLVWAFSSVVKAWSVGTDVDGFRSSQLSEQEVHASEAARNKYRVVS